MKLENLAGLAADIIIADISLAPVLRFAALGIKAAQENDGEVPEEYSKQLDALELDAENEEAQAIIAAKLEEQNS